MIISDIRYLFKNLKEIYYFFPRFDISVDEIRQHTIFSSDYIYQFKIENVTWDNNKTCSIRTSELRPLLAEFLSLNGEKDFYRFFSKYGFLINENSNHCSTSILAAQKFFLDLLNLVNYFPFDHIYEDEDRDKDTNELFVYTMRILFLDEPDPWWFDGTQDVKIHPFLRNEIFPLHTGFVDSPFFEDSYRTFPVTIHDTYNEDDRIWNKKDYPSQSPKNYVEYFIIKCYWDPDFPKHKRKVIDFLMHIIYSYGFDFISDICVNDTRKFDLTDKEKDWVKEIASELILYYLNIALKEVTGDISIEPDPNDKLNSKIIFKSNFKVTHLYHAFLLALLYQNPDKIKMIKCKYCNRYFPVNRSNTTKLYCCKEHAHKKANHDSYLKKKQELSATKTSN